MTKAYNVILSTMILLILCLFLANIIQYPEVYISTWKYQLQNDIKRGNKDAIEYYQNTYLANGKILFETDNNTVNK